jgi:pimeloyl-ACP methyl ester carboxylesterase
MAKQAFTVGFPDEAVDDLRDRLRKVRWPDDFANANWEYGTNLEYLRELTDYWLNKYDWRAREREMNSYSHFKATVEDVPIHFVHERGRGPDPIPLILSHGWPDTFWDFRKVIGPLTNPAAHGGNPADSFDVVIPSLPGFVFSTPLRRTGLNYWRTADLWVGLMRDLLGYERFGAQGHDWGSIVSAQLGHRYAQHMIGVHLTMLVPLPFFAGALPGESHFESDEQGWHEKNSRFVFRETAYQAIQATKPQTLSYALSDSPVGLCAWFLEKRRTWSGCGGDIESRFTKDELLDSVTLYWLTRSVASSLRYYSEAVHNPWKPAHDRIPVVEAPTGVAVFPDEVVLLPRRWAKEYYNLARWTRMSSGGHFPAMEEPEALVGEIREFFRPLR